MNEFRIIKPEDLQSNNCFRLTGDACNENERNDKITYKVIEILEKKYIEIGDRKTLISFICVTEHEEKGNKIQIKHHIAPWVPLYLIS